MKKTNIKYYLSAFLMLFAASSCEDQLDINTNPNSPTTADVELVLPQAIVASASVSNQFNSYGAHFGGYMANAGGFSGFGNLLNYNLTPSDWNNMWVTSYQDALADLKYILDKTADDPKYTYFNAAARIMTVVNYQRLVDAFGDIPYSEALRAEEGFVAPKYDDAATIYQDLFTQLNTAIAAIEAGQAADVAPIRLRKAHDPLFGAAPTATTDRDNADQLGDWKRYANTLKLRILMRLSEKAEFAAFVTAGFAGLDASIGFLADDAIVDPGYELNRPNPTWNSWGKATDGVTLQNSSRIPTTYAFTFYNGTKITDPGRGEAIYVNYPTTPNNQLGQEDGAPTIVAGQVTWASNDATRSGLGVLKGAGMGAPLMLRAEAMFLVSEAILRGFMGPVNSMDDEAHFYAGIKASFAYLYKDAEENRKDTTGLVAAYLDANDANDLVVYDLADTEEEKQEAIITQKYIALNMINSDEGWNEYRRTGYPATVAGGAPAFNIASSKSNVTSRPDRLPTRIVYPTTEQSFNAANFRSIDYTTDLIFWDPN
jgi:hypothetical protein